MQLKTADQATDMIQEDFYEKYNFYMDSCAISQGQIQDFPWGGGGAWTQFGGGGKWTFDTGAFQ